MKQTLSSVYKAGDMAPRDIFHNYLRTHPAPPWHDGESMPQGSDKQQSRHHPRPCSNKGLEHGRETTSHHFRNKFRLPRLDDWSHPLLSEPILQENVQVTQERKRAHQDLPVFNLSSSVSQLIE